jgi:MFS family permease
MGRQMNFDYDENNRNLYAAGYQNSPHPEIEGGQTNITVNLSHEGEHHNDFGDGDTPVSKSTKIFAICAALNSCNLGFDIGVNTSAGQLLQDANSLGLSNTQLEIFNGSLNFFAALGAIAASAISDRYGRRRGFIVAAIGFIIGVLLMAFAQTYSFLMFGRVFVGLGVGFGLAIDPIYIAEISPAKHRGRLVTWSEIATNVGILIGFASGLVFNKVQPDSAWRLMFAIGTIMPVTLIVLVLCVMPESPRWLMKEGREAEARDVLALIYPQGYNTSAVVNDIKDAITREEAAEQAVGWGVILSPSPGFKRMLFVGIGSAIAQQIVGIDAVQYFMMYIIERTGIESRTTQSIILIFLGLLKLVVIFIASNLFDSRGRRPLIVMSLIGKQARILIYFH